MSTKSRKRKSEDGNQSPVDWEEENIFPEEVKNEMESMWEIPQIFQFLHLTKEALNIPHLSMYEMERMLLIPRASKQLANIMTSLLSSPMTKAKLRKIPPMPYEFWTNILAYKMKSWFKVYEAKHQDAVKILETIGVEPEFWNIFPDAPLLNGKDFEELTFKQKVWLLKTVCDTVMHTRKTVQEEIAKQPWENQFETVLGTDRYGARYIYFPQFLKSDLRVYRHCLDNKILSTVKPIKSKLHTSGENKALDPNDLRKQGKRRKRKPRWSNGLPPKVKKRGSRCDEKHSHDCKCNSDSATSSLMNEDTDLSSISTCSSSSSSSSNNNNNNNDINASIINVKRSRSSSKCSEISMESNKTCCTKSSGYDTNCSNDNLPENKSSDRMFKGFSNDNDITDQTCNINMINGILNDLKSEFNEEKNAEESDANLTHTPQNNLELTSSKEQYLDTLNLRVSKSESVDRTIDNLSSVSKTDDEKLNEIISAESLKLNENSDINVDETHQMSTSKSDDEKLNETRINCDPIKEANLSPEKEKHAILRKRNGQFAKKRKSNNSTVNDKGMSNPNRISKSNNEEESNDDKDLSLSELRCMLQKEAMNDTYYLDAECKVDYNNIELKEEMPDVWKQEAEDFNEMLLELSSSKFELVADSIGSLRDLVSTFSQKSDDPNNDSAIEKESIPPCEVKLIKQMTELLATVEKMESALRESTRRARGKLQKEWTNFKEGSAEDQDSSGEGLNSNWWVLGSQNCPTSGDSALQTLSQPSLSSTGYQNQNGRQEDQPANIVKYDQSASQECKEPHGKTVQSGTQRSDSKKGEDNSEEGPAEMQKETKEDSNQESGRVLRTRGISSYAFYSDDETEENELEEWTDVEAVYAAPDAQADSSATYLTPKIRNTDDRTNEEDSDQDWILPSSRKRKNKRPSASRRLKSFQHKLQSIRVDALQNTAEPPVTPTNGKSQTQKPKTNEAQIRKPDNPVNSKHRDDVVENTAENHDNAVQNNAKETVPSVEINCKIENSQSVHSELDIKDEGPIYDGISQCDNISATNFNSNYVMVRGDHNPMNYYVMQSNPVNVAPQNVYGQPSPMVSNIVSPIQQSYYVHDGQNYIIHNPQPNFIPSQPFQPQGPQMMTPQQFISQPGYVPYMVTPQSHPGYVPTHSQIVAAQKIPQNRSMYIQPPMPVTRLPQNRYSIPQQQNHPYGAVIRSTMPIRGSFPRASNGKTTKNVQQPPVGTSAKVQKAKKQVVPSENTGQKTTSLIVLSDSDDEIEMIITESTSPNNEPEEAKASPRKTYGQARQTVIDNSTDTPATTTKSAISTQMNQRINQGGISTTPVKSAPPVQNTSTQLVVVVNETGSHYALALPNGSKLILTPEQVAQIRASNGGKLIL